jgi:predicted DNA-binding protein
MATTKVTFTLDRESVEQLERTAERLAMPKSQVVREAIHDYHARLGRLSEAERARMLRVFDEVVSRIPSRPAREVDAELAGVRAARRTGGRAGGAKNLK